MSEINGHETALAADIQLILVTALHYFIWEAQFRPFSSEIPMFTKHRIKTAIVYVGLNVPPYIYIYIYLR